MDGRGGAIEPATDWVSDNRAPEGEPDRELRAHRVLEGGAEWSGGYERDEIVARAYRLRTMAFWGGVAFMSFLPTDLPFNVLRGSDHGLIFILIRLLGTLPLVCIWLRLRRRPTPSARALFVFEAIGTGSVACALAIMAMLSGSIGSPLLAGLLPLLVVRGIGIPDPWRRGLVLAGAPALVFWTVIIVGSLAYPELVERDDRALANLILLVGAHLVTMGMVVIGSHLAWDLRRSLYRARRVGRYELLRPLGRGAMGEVWVAWHQGLRQEVALKILALDTADPAAVERFEREVVATTKLRHPNTVRVYDFGLTADGLWYYAMELLDGETVAELVAREGPLASARALQLLRQAARALREAHQRGVVHRDIKPENIFVSAPAGERDVVKVLDFGIATIAAEALRHDDSTEPVSLPGQDGPDAPTDPGYGPEPESERAVGTPLTISPEAARGRPTDARSDIYGLGCVLYFMLTGRPPFLERDAPSLLRAHVEAKPTPPSALLSSPLPDYLDKLVMRCLAKDPEDRYADADALVRAIDLCMRLGENDRRRGEGSLPRARVSAEQIEAWAEQSRTDTDMTLIKE